MIEATLTWISSPNLILWPFWKEEIVGLYTFGRSSLLSWVGSLLLKVLILLLPSTEGACKVKWAHQWSSPPVLNKGTDLMSRACSPVGSQNHRRQMFNFVVLFPRQNQELFDASMWWVSYVHWDMWNKIYIIRLQLTKSKLSELFKLTLICFMQTLFLCCS